MTVAEEHNRRVYHAKGNTMIPTDEQRNELIDTWIDLESKVYDMLRDAIAVPDSMTMNKGKVGIRVKFYEIKESPTQGEPAQGDLFELNLTT